MADYKNLVTSVPITATPPTLPDVNVLWKNGLDFYVRLEDGTDVLLGGIPKEQMQIIAVPFNTTFVWGAFQMSFTTVGNQNLRIAPNAEVLDLRIMSDYVANPTLNNPKTPTTYTGLGIGTWVKPSAVSITGAGGAMDFYIEDLTNNRRYKVHFNRGTTTTDTIFVCYEL